MLTPEETAKLTEYANTGKHEKQNKVKKPKKKDENPLKPIYSDCEHCGKEFQVDIYHSFGGDFSRCQDCKDK